MVMLWAAAFVAAPARAAEEPNNLVVETVDGAGGGLASEVRVMPAGGTAVAARGKGPKAEFRLPAGKYDLTVRVAGPSQEKVITGVEVPAGGTTVQKVSVPVARLRVEVKDAGDLPIDAKIVVYRMFGARQERWLESGSYKNNVRAIPLFPGKYKLVVTEQKTGQSQVMRPFELAAGENLTRVVSFGQARINAYVTNQKGEPEQGRVTVYRLEAGRRIEVDAAWAVDQNPAVFRLPPGVYSLVFRHEQSKQNLTLGPVTLNHGEEVNKVASFEESRILVAARDSAGNLLECRVTLLAVEPKGRTKEVDGAWCDAREAARFNPPPGDYIVRVEHMASRQQEDLPAFKLPPGQEVRLEATFQVGKLTVQAKNAAGRELPGQVTVYQLVGELEREVDSGPTAPGEPAVFLLPPARYKVVVQSPPGTGPSRFIKGIEVQAGAGLERTITF